MRTSGSNTDKFWALSLVLLALATLANAAWTFRESLLESPALRGQLQRIGLLDAGLPAPVGDPGSIRLVSRDLRAHPERTGILVLSATFVSRSAQPLSWPLLELTLHSAAQHNLAARRFEPSEYLGRAPRAGELLEPGVHVPIRLEFADPGAHATGFELQFR